MTFRRSASGATGPSSRASRDAVSPRKAWNDARFRAAPVNSRSVSDFVDPASRSTILTVTLPAPAGEAAIAITDRAASAESARVNGCSEAMDVASISGVPRTSASVSLSRTASVWTGGKYTARKTFAGLSCAAAEAATAAASRRTCTSLFTAGTRTRGKARVPAA